MHASLSTGTKIKRGLLVLWLLLVAGLPLYYLMPDRDWNYEVWGAPETIMVSRIRQENPWRGDEGVNSRIFIARPSAENMSRLREFSASSSCAERMQSLLAEYELPAPHRYGDFFGHGWVDVAVCSNGLILVADYSRNKGGLTSSRISWNTVMEHYPLHFRLLYCWAVLGVMILLLTPILAIPAAVCCHIVRVIRAFWRNR